MTIKQFNKITEVVKNGGVVIADQYHETYVDTHYITEDTDILTLLEYAKENYHFYIKDGVGKALYELEEIK